MAEPLDDGFDAVLPHPAVGGLADPGDLENLAVYHWMTKHRVRLNGKSFALGTTVLSPHWQHRVERFASAAAARAWLGASAAQPAVLLVMRQLLGIAEHACLQPQPNDVTIDRFTAALAARRIWVMALPRRLADLHDDWTDPAVYAALNGRYGGNRVNFRYVADNWEGGQYLRGYLPFSGHVVAGASGITIATAFDVGQKNLTEVKLLGLPERVIQVITPFLTHRFTGETRVQAAASFAKIGSPMPEITKAEADAVDLAIHDQHLRAAMTAWAADKQADVPAFKDLPVAWQTVIFSRFFHQGVGMNATAVAQPFWKAATSGQWAQAVTALRSYAVTAAWYRSRVATEAAYLQSEMPAPIVKPSAPGKPGGPGAPAALPGRP